MSATGTVLVTSAGGHLGPRIARLLAARSFTLAINDIDEQSAGLLAESIVGAVPFPADVSDDEAASRRRSAVDTGSGTEPFQPVSPLVVKGVRVTAAPLAIHEVVPVS